MMYGLNQMGVFFSLTSIGPCILITLICLSGSHPGMVCLCGRAISDNLRIMLNHETRNLSYKSWQDFSITHLYDKAHASITFQSMITSLLMEGATDAVNLLRSRFVGFLGEVSIGDPAEQPLADFLTTEGVLLRPDIYTPCYQMASALIDELVRQFVIPQKFPNTPSLHLPARPGDGGLVVLEVLTESLKFFDKSLLRLAAIHSYKPSKVKIDGYCAVQVPRESVYDTELIRTGSSSKEHLLSLDIGTCELAWIMINTAIS